MRVFIVREAVTDVRRSPAPTFAAETHDALKNRIMTTSHEPAYPKAGRPKDCNRADYADRAKAGGMGGIEIRVYDHTLDQF